MRDIDEIRRENLRQIENELGGATEAAKIVGMSPAQFINLRTGAKDSKTGKPRGMRKETARRIEIALQKPLGWLDTPQAEKSALLDESARFLIGAYRMAEPRIQAAVRLLLMGEQAVMGKSSNIRQFVN